MAAGTVSPEDTPQRKPLDVNKYATKKTIAQGMLDIALLTANASQLKYILQVGEKHEFYSLMLGLISISIILQVVVGVLFLVIGGLDIKRTKEQNSATILNDIILVLIFIISLINVVISSFGMEYSNNRLRLVAVGVLTVVLTQMNHTAEGQQLCAEVLNHTALGCSLLAMVSDVIKMSFGLDPALSYGDFERYRNITRK